MEIDKSIIAYCVGWKFSGNSLCFINEANYFLDEITLPKPEDLEKETDNDIIPSFETSKETWAFLSGILDNYGYVATPYYENSEPRVGIYLKRDKLLAFICNFVTVPYHTNLIDRIEWHGNNALDFLGRIFEHSPLRLKKHFIFYKKIATWVPTNSYFESWQKFAFQFARTRPDAVPPYKMRVSDSGYDLTILELVKTVGDVRFYETGIKVKPNFGIYFDLVPRSSLSKTGYILANSVGIIDRTYTDSIKVALRKIDSKAPDIELPMRLVQLVPRHIIHADWTELPDLDDTDRGAGGFGSTNK